MTTGLARLDEIVNGDNKDYIRQVLGIVCDEIRVIAGAMILDGYETEDSCVKFVSDLADEMQKKINSF